jgi:hypothetical protein
MQATKQAHQYRFAATKIINGDFALAGNRVKHNIGCPVARL